MHVIKKNKTKNMMKGLSSWKPASGNLKKEFSTAKVGTVYN